MIVILVKTQTMPFGHILMAICIYGGLQNSGKLRTSIFHGFLILLILLVESVRSALQLLFDLDTVLEFLDFRISLLHSLSY